MFVGDFVLVDRPFAAVAPRFGGDDLPLESFARRAVSPIGEVRCTRGPVRARGAAIVVPIQIIDTEHPEGPGSLEGELEVAPFEDRTELGFAATYRADAAPKRELHRVTQLAVRRLLHAVGQALEHDVPSTFNGPTDPRRTAE